MKWIKIYEDFKVDNNDWVVNFIDIEKIRKDVIVKYADSTFSNVDVINKFIEKGLPYDIKFNIGEYEHNWLTYYIKNFEFLSKKLKSIVDKLTDFLEYFKQFNGFNKFINHKIKINNEYYSAVDIIFDMLNHSKYKVRNKGDESIKFKSRRDISSGVIINKHLLYEAMLILTKFGCEFNLNIIKDDRFKSEVIDILIKHDDDFKIDKIDFEL